MVAYLASVLGGLIINMHCWSAKPASCCSAFHASAMGDAHCMLMLRWLQILRLSPWLPALEELHACGNGIRSLAADGMQGGACPNTGMLAHLQARSRACLLVSRLAGYRETRWLGVL